MRLLSLILFTVISLTSSAQATYVLRSAPFTHLAISGPIQVECRQVPDSASLVVITATADALDALYSAHAAGTLTLSMRRRVPPNQFRKVIVYLGSVVESLAIRGAASVTIPTLGAPDTDAVVMINGTGCADIGNISASVANVTLNGNHQIKIGKTDAKILNLDSSGAGRIIADNINATTLNLNLRGSGGITATGSVMKSTSAVASGTGTINLCGLSSPACKTTLLSPEAKIITEK